MLPASTLLAIVRLWARHSFPQSGLQRGEPFFAYWGVGAPVVAVGVEAEAAHIHAEDSEAKDAVGGSEIPIPLHKVPRD